jgi:hypothetical protein
MRLGIRILAVAAALSVLIPTLTAQEKDKDKPKTDLKDNPSKLPTIGGKLVNSGTDKGHITVSVPYTYPERSGRNIVTRVGHKNVDLAPADEMIIRRKLLPVLFDDKGKPRKPTQKELKELKGEGNLPGYMAEASDLKANQMVTCYVQTKKKTAKKDDPDALTDNKPKVRMIVIESEP